MDYNFDDAQVWVLFLSFISADSTHVQRESTKPRRVITFWSCEELHGQKDEVIIISCRLELGLHSLLVPSPREIAGLFFFFFFLTFVVKKKSCRVCVLVCSYNTSSLMSRWILQRQSFSGMGNVISPAHSVVLVADSVGLPDRFCDFCGMLEKSF